MVLSNKKLKQKLRAAKAEQLVASEVQNNFADKDPKNSRFFDSKNSPSPRTVLNVEVQKPKLSKREKQRQKAQQDSLETIKNRQIISNEKVKKEDNLKSDDVKVNMKKRKRDESQAAENVKEEKPEQLRKAKKTKHKKKAKKKGGTGKDKVEGGVQNGSGISRDQHLPKGDESIPGLKQQLKEH